MADKKVYVVFGERGEYSDYGAWCVTSYRNPDMAERHAEEATKAAERALEDRFTEDGGFNPKWGATGVPSAWDPELEWDDVAYGRTKYSVVELDMDARWPGK